MVGFFNNIMYGQIVIRMGVLVRRELALGIITNQRGIYKWGEANKEKYWEYYHSGKTFYLSYFNSFEQV